MSGIRSYAWWWRKWVRALFAWAALKLKIRISLRIKAEEGRFMCLRLRHIHDNACLHGASTLQGLHGPHVCADHALDSFVGLLC